MANKEKFSKEISDNKLDNVAGGANFESERIDVKNPLDDTKNSKTPFPPHDNDPFGGNDINKIDKSPFTPE